MGVNKKFNTSGLGGDGRNKLNSWRFLSRAVIFLLVAGVPAAIAWLQGHEMACGWSPGWQRFAGLFGDCAVYAEKPTQVVVPMDLTGLSGPKTKSQIRAEKNAFDQRRFLDAVNDNDAAELDLLQKEGFRLTSTEACKILGNGNIPRKPSLLAELERFAQERIACKLTEVRHGKILETTIDGPTYLLYVDWGGGRSTRNAKDLCWHPDSDILSLIDSWIRIRPSEGLQRISKHLLKAYEMAEKASLDQLKQMCKDQYASSTDTPSEVSIFQTNNKDDLVDAVFSFSASCEKVGRVAGHDERPVMTMGVIASMCNLVIEKTGIHSKAAYMKEYLVRWSR